MIPTIVGIFWSIFASVRRTRRTGLLWKSTLRERLQSKQRMPGKRPKLLVEAIRGAWKAR
jgi:hypothetical protein